MKPQERKAFELALEMVQNKMYAHAEMYLKEALAQEKALQALHDENERLGLYKDVYEQQRNEQVEPVAWVSFAERKPPVDAATDNPSVIAGRSVLVTNNINARDRMNQRSHVWLVVPIETDKGEWVGFTDSSQKIIGLTHWFDPFSTHPPVPTAQFKEHEKTDVRCECCGYMTYHREHLGYIRAARTEQNPQRSEDVNLSCKSTQARLAASWGYVKAEPLTDKAVSDQQCRRLLYGFMLDFNAVGFEQAGRNLHRAMKEAVHGIDSETTLVKE